MTTDLSVPNIAGLYAAIGAELSAREAGGDPFGAVSRAALRWVPAAEWASLTQGRRVRFQSVGATADAARAADGIQYELGTGPCVDAALTESVYRTDDLSTDDRWPEFSRRAVAELAVRSMLSYRLFIEDDDVIAALNLYSTRPGAFDAEAEVVGTLVATHGGLAITAALGRERAAHLERALLNRREIGIAMGVLMTRHKIDRDQAFDLLRVASQHSNRKLAEIATEVADTGVLQLPRTAARSRGR